MKRWDQLPWSQVSQCWALTQLFHCPLSLSSRGSLVLHFLPKSGIICISEVTDISPSNLDSSLCFIQPGMLHDLLYIKVKLAGWQYTTLTYFFPNLEILSWFLNRENWAATPMNYEAWTASPSWEPTLNSSLTEAERHIHPPGKWGPRVFTLI